MGKDALKKLIASTDDRIHDEKSDVKEYKNVKELSVDELIIERENLRKSFNKKQSAITEKIREIEEVKNSGKSEEEVEEKIQERIQLSKEKRVISARIREINLELTQRQR